jgi:hypothetical protein
MSEEKKVQIDLFGDPVVSKLTKAQIEKAKKCPHVKKEWVILADWKTTGHVCPECKLFFPDIIKPKIER